MNSVMSLSATVYQNRVLALKFVYSSTLSVDSRVHACPSYHWAFSRRRPSYVASCCSSSASCSCCSRWSLWSCWRSCAGHWHSSNWARMGHDHHRRTTRSQHDTDCSYASVVAMPPFALIGLVMRASTRFAASVGCSPTAVHCWPHLV